jgi:hypothetical protein
MPDLTEEQRIAMARQIALALHKMMAGVPENVMMEASIMLLKSLFIAGVKPEYRLSLFNSVTKKMRDEIKTYGKAEEKQQ